MTPDTTTVQWRFTLEQEMAPAGFRYPATYQEFVSGALPDLLPWRFLCADEPEFLLQGLKSRYPSRTLVPFARRVDCDDIACFDASVPDQDPPVLFVHDFASPGWELRGRAENFLEWLEVARSEAGDWLNE